MDNDARAALDLAGIDVRNCTEWRSDLLREEIGRVQGVYGIGQRRMKGARDAGAFERGAELGPVRAIPTYNFIEVAELGNWKTSYARKIEACRSDGASPGELNQRQDR